MALKFSVAIILLGLTGVLQYCDSLEKIHHQQLSTENQVLCPPQGQPMYFDIYQQDVSNAHRQSDFNVRRELFNVQASSAPQIELISGQIFAHIQPSVDRTMPPFHSKSGNVQSSIQEIPQRGDTDNRQNIKVPRDESNIAVELLLSNLPVTHQPRIPKIDGNLTGEFKTTAVSEEMVAKPTQTTVEEVNMFVENAPWITELNDDIFEKLVVKSPKYWLIVFYTRSCRFSRQFAPYFKNITFHFQGLMSAGAIDLDSNAKCRNAYNVTRYPTVLMFFGDKRTPGIYPPRGIKEIIPSKLARTAIQSMVSNISNIVHKINPRFSVEFVENIDPHSPLLPDE